MRWYDDMYAVKWWCTLSLTRAMIWCFPWCDDISLTRAMIWCFPWCDDILLCTMMCTWYIHITCWWWWWLLDDDDGTYSMTLMYNLWWCSEIAEQRFFSNCGWQWAVCGSDIYRDDLTVTRVQRLSTVEVGVWQVHRFNNILLIRVEGWGKERRA